MQLNIRLIFLTLYASKRRLSSQFNLGEHSLQTLHYNLSFLSVFEYEEVVSKFKVVRSHEDFQWLHSVIEENPAYAGLIIPPRFSSNYIDVMMTE